MLFKALNFFAKEISQSKRIYNKDWKYQDLRSTPYLYGTYYLAQLTRGANNRGQVLQVMHHIDRHKVGYLEGYKVIYQKCESKLKGFDRVSKFDSMYS